MTKLEQLPLSDLSPSDIADPHGGIVYAGESFTTDVPISPLDVIDKAYAQHYENTSLSRRAFPRCVLIRTKLPVPAEICLPPAIAADGFALVIQQALKVSYEAETHIIDVGDTVISDDKHMSATIRLKSFTDHYENAFLLMLEDRDIKKQYDEMQIQRRAQLRATIAELLVPALTIVSSDPVRMN